MGVGLLGNACFYPSPVFLNPYQGGLGCALPFAPVYSLGERRPMFNQMDHAMGINSGMGGGFFLTLTLLGILMVSKLPLVRRRLCLVIIKE